MPELPEVEVTRLGISPPLVGKILQGAIVREPRLRLAVNSDLEARIAGQQLRQIRRRGKYLLLDLDTGSILIHLGMSGHLRVLPQETPVVKHDHVDLLFSQGICLRFHDPRRFGVLRWLEAADAHPLIAHLGPEPLGPDFSGDYLYAHSRQRQMPVKTFLMDAHQVVGVGNIYANEALFDAGIDPRRPAGRISLDRYRRLAEAVRGVLEAAIRQGGTTLRDFTRPDGKNGYFRLSLAVYGRAGQACNRCGKTLLGIRIGGRATTYCSHCQH
ncbi:bifunctional DNA-formamidopyrimidine glycosylase/DNA-(apurinic or apyrimidinic site) lyase [Acidithiobacillus sp. M4-SHS-6]|uniref:bifunctional DNA-formamidopyrimidine glycosylase/DNA-(apurinic or apyrimidinic site) lyase n=1 Tax=Acidithiobacillus sp. M4-SHS-6 TaxID=3383024 RepID=UPI0039BE110D